jgi:hypothetical protein
MNNQKQIRQTDRAQSAQVEMQLASLRGQQKDLERRSLIERAGDMHPAVKPFGYKEKLCLLLGIDERAGINTIDLALRKFAA